MLAGANGFHAAQPLSQRMRKNAVHGVHGGLGDVKRRFPESQHLREAVAVIRVFVGDEDAVDAVDSFFDSGEPRQRFALAQAGVYEEAGALGFEQGDVARTSGRQNGNPQADLALLNLPYYRR